MTIEALRSEIPDYAKDIRLNLGSLFNETILTDQQKYGCLLACAFAGREPTVIKYALEETSTKLSPEAAQAAKTAAAIMAMNNVYYRATHLLKNTEYLKLPAKLRMNAIGNPGVEKVDFELWSLAVSAINGCGLCLDSHENVLRKEGLSLDQVQAALRIGAVVYAASAIIDAENAANAS